MGRGHRAASRRPTIKDVARAAGVSVTTVSNVLNGRTGSMTPDTHDRVRTVIEDLNYHRNDLARGLVRRRTSTIGLVIAEIDTPLFLQAINVIQPAAREAGFDILIYSARDEAAEQQANTVLFEKDVAGVIFLSTSSYASHDHILQLTRAGTPVVLVNRWGHPEAFDSIRWDNVAAAADAVAHLVGLGHRRIAHLCGPAHRHSSVERLQGYREGLAAAGLPFQEELVRTADYTGEQDAWRAATAQLLALTPPPTAIFSVDDTVAAVAMRACQQHGVRVPHDVSVIGIDDQPFDALLSPPLTTMRLPVLEAGRAAIRMLLDRIAGDASDPHAIVLSCPLVLRDSTAPASGPR
jgi:DNA-binding LacI/PurR family transcriptional regulator